MKFYLLLLIGCFIFPTLWKDVENSATNDDYSDIRVIKIPPLFKEINVEDVKSASNLLNNQASYTKLNKFLATFRNYEILKYFYNFNEFNLFNESLDMKIKKDFELTKKYKSHQLNIFLKHQKDLVDRAIELGYKKILYALDICTTTVFVNNEINCEDLRNKAFELLKIANIKFVNSVERAKGIRLSTSSKNFQRLKLAVELLSKVTDINKDLEIIKEQAKYALEFCSNVGVLYEEAEDIEYLKKYCEETVNVKANELLESVGIQFIIPEKSSIIKDKVIKKKVGFNNLIIKEFSNDFDKNAMPELVFPKIQENNQEINEKKMSVEEKLKNDKNFKQLNKSIELVKNKNVYIAILGAIERFKKEKNSEYKKIAENLKNREDFSKFVEDLERKAEKSSRRKNSLDSFNQAEKDLNAMVELVNAGFLHVLFVHEFCLKVDKIYPDNDVVKEFLHKYCKKDMKDALKNAKLLLDFVSKKDDKKSTLMSYLSSGCTVKSDDVIEPSSKKPSKKN